MKTWQTEDDAFILSCVKENDNLCDAFDYSAKLLNRTASSIRGRYYNHLRRAKLTKRNKSKCIVINKDTVSEYREEYRKQEDVTIIILHIRGKS
jgi:hypothetical protein